MSIFVSSNTFFSKSILSDINIATLALFSLVFIVYYIFSHLFTFNHFVSLFLKHVCCKQHILGFCFLSSLTLFAF